MGTTLDRPVRYISKSQGTAVQQLGVRSTNFGHRCFGTNRLGATQQLCQPTIWRYQQNLECNTKAARYRHFDRPMVAGPIMVSPPTANVSLPPCSTGTSTGHSPTTVRRDTRAIEKPPLENVRLEDKWYTRLRAHICGRRGRSGRKISPKIAF